MPEWVAGHLEPIPPKALASPGNAPRSLLLASAAIVLLLLVPFTASIVTDVNRAALLACILGLDGGIVTYGFHLDPAARDRAALMRQRRRLRRRTSRGIRKITRLQRTRATVNERFDRAVNKERVSEARDLDAMRCRRETVQQTVRDALNALRPPLESLETWRFHEWNSSITRSRDGHLERQLRMAKIASAGIPRVGVGDKAQLWLAGIRTAADVNVSNGRSIANLGPKKAASLLAWRTQISSRAQTIAPAAPPDRTARRITNIFRKRKAAIEREQRRVLRDAAAVLSRLSATSEWRQAATQTALARRSVEHSTGIRQLEDELEQRVAEYEGEADQLAEVEIELEPYENVTFLRYFVSVLRGKRSPSMSHP